ncbi:hypothetical protein OS242_09975 [Tumebacillus sp. DT12]|uniref:Uncharacterized protein n=1 Tax=Tumebacillus lacus TaxID=2995335 RepID=A0ABT3X057_9BACL|nr:hypothetical protein [Tumebacillus lacus]MCX7570290.1 hypothetical protein [Tumebacillus lacus]
MTRRSAGVAFIGFAIWLFGIRYVAAAIYGAGISVDNEYSKETFARFLSYIGDLPLTLSIVSLVIGLLYLLWAEREAK